MARKLRVSLCGAIYHVMLRGNNGQPIFTNDYERRKFCLLLQEGVERFGYKVLAFCFMSNHIHLAIQIDTVSLSKIVQNLACRYTKFYNWRHKTVGHLFQGRFKSVVVDSGGYLHELIRYIHLNPVRAKLVNHPQDYYWSSHRAYLMLDRYQWLSTDWVLMRFRDSKSEAITAFNDFVLAGIGMKEETHFEVGISDGILGEDDFIKKINVLTVDSNNINLESLISTISKRYNVDLKSPLELGMDRRKSHIRAVSALIARNTKGVSLEELAKFFRRDASSMSVAAKRLELRIRTSENLNEEVNSVKEQCLTEYRLKCQNVTPDTSLTLEVSECHA